MRINPNTGDIISYSNLFCPNCDGDLYDNYDYCDNCGEYVGIIYEENEEIITVTYDNGEEENITLMNIIKD